MAEFIGSTISLISKRDIRYVGTLHEISSENATVALKNVRSFGTEGRKPGEEVAPNSTVYEFIVFKGSDVKDLRIEEAPKEPEPVQAQIPDDPAIIESTRKTTPGGNAPQPTHSAGPQSGQNQPGQQPFPPPGPNQRQHFPQMPYPPYGFPPHDPRFGPQGFPPGPPPPGYPQMPYGGPQQWYPPPGPGRFYPGQHPGPHPGQHPGQPLMPIGPPGQQQKSPAQPPPGAPTGPAAGNNKKGNQGSGQPGKSNATTPAAPAARGPAPPTDTKPGVEAALAPPAPVQDQLDGQAASGPNKSRIVPAVPLPNAAKNVASANGTATAATVAAQGAAAGTAQTMAAKLTQSARAPVPGQGQAKKSLEDANRDARAAVEQAMAKLASGKNATPNTAVDNLTQQMQSLQASTNGAQGGRRPSQTRGRGNRHREQTRKIEVPKDDFDFESSNAKFNKQDLVKEAIATGSPIASPVDGASPSELPASSSTAVASYNKSSSFFDNISSEIKERAEGTTEQVGGREFRNEERRKNMETFGQGSVDSGYRHRGRGRGRGGYRGRGRGRGGGGGGNMRGGQGTVTTES